MKKRLLVAVSVLFVLAACGQQSSAKPLDDTAPVNVSSSLLSVDAARLTAVTTSAAADAAMPKEYHYVRTMVEPRTGDTLRQYATSGFEAALKSGADIGPTIIIRTGKHISPENLAGLPDVAFTQFKLDSSNGLEAVLSDASKLPPNAQQVIINTPTSSTQVVGTGVPEATVTTIASGILSASSSN